MVRQRRQPKRAPQGQEGIAAMELALVLPIFLLLCLGVGDLSHAWYTKQTVINASREGARYGSRYNESAGTRSYPNALSPSIVSYVQDNYGASLTVTPSGAGYTSTTAGSDLTVTVSATKTWWILGTLIPSLGSTMNVTSSTVMKLE